MTAISFTIPYPATRQGLTAWNRRYSLNAYWSGKPYHARNRDARELHQLTGLCMGRAGVPRELLDFPVEVRFRWDDGLDADNHAAMGKMILDAMKGYILRDDSRKWVKRVSHEFWDGKKILVEVRPYDQQQAEKELYKLQAPAATGRP
ncbi:MAG: RusA family crossover junction endodeoxyribonuclease [Oscillospiraceae bacterium]|nr:RusA family crossover junction endodeoxyribonuclease [Oscillospiraceae bacterium]